MTVTCKEERMGRRMCRKDAQASCGQPLAAPRPKYIISLSNHFVLDQVKPAWSDIQFVARLEREQFVYPFLSVLRGVSR
jgi:hypothetical protein